jgi:diguanylate cyclase (GGDEF)-like protein
MACCLISLYPLSSYDKFKIINDSCGHHTGDQLLHDISNLLKQKLYGDDVLARVGGDEFCMILWGVDNKSVELRVQTLIDHVAAYRFVWQEKVFHVSVSIGLVHVEAGASDVVSLVQEADLACYQAKSNGKNQFCVYESSGLQESFRKQELDILELLQFAIEHNKLQLYFQTIKPLGSSSTNHNYEVLLRMFDKNGAMISPSVFIPVAERNGLMSRVDTWVFEHTINLLERHPKHTLLLDKCAINLSGASLNSPSLLLTILQRLQETTVPLNKLCFEITETAAVMNLVTASKMIDKIRLLGCQFALDDFGAGMSSFTYLKNMNVDYVKIDGSFVKNMSKDICDFATVKAIHEIARSMGKQTIAEFVGDEETEQLLRQLGVDFAQGFSIAYPMPMLPMLSQN